MLSTNLIPCRNGYKIKGTNVTVRTRPDVKNWEVCIYFKEKRKYKIYSSHTENLDEAIVFGLRKEAELQFKQEHGIEIFPANFEKVAMEWIKYLRQREENGSQSSSVLVIYESIIRNHMIPFFGGMSINSIKHNTLESYVKRLINAGTSSEKSFDNHNMTLTKLLKYAQDRGIYKQHSIPRLEIPTYKLEKGEPRTRFTDGEIEMIVNNLDRYIDAATTDASKYNRKVMRAFIQFMLATGCRTNDLQLLRWSDFQVRSDDDPDLKIPSDLIVHMFHLIAMAMAMNVGPSSFLYVFLRGKKIERWVPVDKSFLGPYIVMRQESKYVKPDDLFFAANNGKWYQSTSSWFKDYLKFLGIRDKVDDGIRTLYSLRHTFITKKLIEGVNPFDVALQCGTSVKHIQNTYCHMLPADLFTKIFKPTKTHRE